MPTPEFEAMKNVYRPELEKAHSGPKPIGILESYENSKKVFSVDVGDMSAEKAKAHLDELKS